MIGILHRNGNSTFGRCGCKVLRLIDDINVDHEGRFSNNGRQYQVPENGTLTIDFEESDISKETMTTLVINRCSVLENCECVIANKHDLVYDMNTKHMQRFTANYSEAFRGYLDLELFKTLDVIDLKNIKVVQTNPNSFARLPVFAIGESGKAEKVGEGIGDYFTEDNNYLYMAVPNSWHRIQRQDDDKHLVIDSDVEKTKSDLMFVKYSKDTLSSFSVVEA